MTNITTIDDEWNDFISIQNNDCETNEYEQCNNLQFLATDCPKSTDIYISTKSKIAYLTQPIDLNIFWNLKVSPYSIAESGIIIKKQIKFNSKTVEELNFIQNKLKEELYYEENVISHIDNPFGRIKFKDTRKISVGLSKKDLMTYRSKKKQEFYNCFVIILRIKNDDCFKEFHVKVFNTGKLDIPGVQNETQFASVLETVLLILQPHVENKLSYEQKSDTVLINSNFNCGYYIKREELYDILKKQYNIQAIYDPCSYPGIQCKFYYNTDLSKDEQSGVSLENRTNICDIIENKKIKNKKNKQPNIIEVSFMIFRTGSVLIVGMCNEDVLMVIYEFLKKILVDEFHKICQQIITDTNINKNKNKNKKTRKKQIYMTHDNHIPVNISSI